ncbi:MAG TPA: hypothetical protein PK307_05200 [Spirochaetota bacterium]|nr:hypothetical protein [Spirochaetota bacterium]HOD13965.1 hypothetical protein [Spirochaetota bacterium]HPG51907.1 hypothetical protein [Spirochaetota bacterium]HQL81575.1 hypothetical protein [Spirochaetota bacterium]
MKKTGHEAHQLEQLLGKYRFTRPVPPEVRDSIISAKKDRYLSVIKTAGVFTAVQGAFASIYFALKKTGIGFTIVKVIAAGMSVLTISIGGYYAANALRDRFFPGAENPASDTSRPDSGWVDEIMLFDGRIIRGAIISRGEPYRVRTEGGIMLIPRKQIKAVRPLTGERAPAR